MATNSGLFSKEWIEAGRRLSLNPESKVCCPSCKSGFLEVHDIPYETSLNLRRYMVCPRCDEFYSMQIKK